MKRIWTPQSVSTLKSWRLIMAKRIQRMQRIPKRSRRPKDLFLESSGLKERIIRSLFPIQRKRVCLRMYP